MTGVQTCALPISAMAAKFCTVVLLMSALVSKKVAALIEIDLVLLMPGESPQVPVTEQRFLARWDRSGR